MPKTLSGNLDTFSLADLLQWLEINALSGRVTLTRGDVRRAVDLQGGSIVYVSSSRPDERLGVYLSKRGYLNERVVYELLAENFITGKNVTRLILDRRLMSRERLAEVVEGLATQVLLDLFHWRGARFEFDPLHKTEDILQIHLSLRGQIMAFHGVKSVDDSARIRLAAGKAEESESAWEIEFLPEALAGMFWTILENLPPDGAGPSTIRDRYYVFNLYSSEVHRRLRDPFHPLPIFDDTAVMLLSVLDEGADPDRIVQLSALDPFLTVNLLYLANSLRGPQNRVRSAREGADVVGPEALRRYIALLAGPHTPKTSSQDKMERVLRRAGLSTAVAATHLAPALGVDAEHAYTMGLIEPLGGYDLLKILMTLDFPRGPFRAATLERFRALFGRALAQKLNFPRELEDVLGCDGRVTARSPSAEQLIFFAKQMVPSEQIGREWTSEDPSLADSFAAIQSPDLPERIQKAIGMLCDILRL